MKPIFSAIVFALTIGLAPGAHAQDATFIQIEAQPSLRAAEQAARGYAAALEAVNGFAAGGGWYAIALGPFTEEDATARLDQLRAQGAIPGDSFLATADQFQSQFWPVGANALTAAPQARATQDQTTQAAATLQPADIPEETRAEAQRSERELSREDRMELQVALQWEGFYNSGIDGAFGPGTRGAMREYQAAMGYEETGVLTTRQRTELLARRQAVIDSLGMRTIRDREAGIEIAVPAGMVGFTRYEAPFAHYESTDASNVRVVLISQSGNQDTLFGLYDILQTLEIVPMEGPRERGSDEFTLTGANDRIVSHTYAKLVDGAVKGFTLVWPVGDEKRRDLALREMKASFTPTDGALADNAGLDQATQSLDLLSGLDIRRPDRSRSGFYVDDTGAVLTTAAAVDACARITLDNTYEATVAAVNESLGLALLKPTERLAPIATARLLAGQARLKSEVAVSGYSYQGRLSAPTLTYGTLDDIKGLGGEADLTRLALAAEDGDAGGPVFDASGTVIGMLLERRDPAGRQLPADVNFAANSAALAAFLSENGVTATAADAGQPVDPVDLDLAASDMTVLVSCWN